MRCDESSAGARPESPCCAPLEASSHRMTLGASGARQERAWGKGALILGHAHGTDASTDVAVVVVRVDIARIEEQAPTVVRVVRTERARPIVAE